ncbi:hypothetical protein LY78DRAFT_385553 [Colletotrichum sublineola]|nr:hypothetical protein LY78DRAFT_385553 [Colletotrichum sublineola]
MYSQSRLLCTRRKNGERDKGWLVSTSTFIIHYPRLPAKGPPAPQSYRDLGQDGTRQASELNPPHPVFHATEAATCPTFPQHRTHLLSRVSPRPFTRSSALLGGAHCSSFSPSLCLSHTHISSAAPPPLLLTTVPRQRMPRPLFYLSTVCPPSQLARHSLNTHTHTVVPSHPKVIQARLPGILQLSSCWCVLLPHPATRLLIFLLLLFQGLLCNLCFSSVLVGLLVVLSFLPPPPPPSPLPCNCSLLVPPHPLLPIVLDASELLPRAGRRGDEHTLVWCTSHIQVCLPAPRQTVLLGVRGQSSIHFPGQAWQPLCLSVLHNFTGPRCPLTDSALFPGFCACALPDQLSLSYSWSTLTRRLSRLTKATSTCRERSAKESTLPTQYTENYSVACRIGRSRVESYHDFTICPSNKTSKVGQCRLLSTSI